jgi:two-component system cell cycle response regulator CpdR
MQGGDRGDPWTAGAARALRAALSISRLLLREDEPRRVVDRACELLVNGGYDVACVRIAAAHGLPAIDGHAGAVACFCDGGQGCPTASPTCVGLLRQSRRSQVVMVHEGCCASCQRGGPGGVQPLVGSLVHRGERIGVFAIAAPSGVTLDDEEPAVLAGLADDLALRLHQAGRGGAASEPARDPAGVAAAGGLRVLLVDDDSNLRRALGRILKRLGHRVHPAASADEALALVEDADTPFDLLLTDVVMPGRDGVELAREFLAVQPGAKVVLMSGSARVDPAGLGAPEGSAAFVRKPFSAAALERLIEALVAER